MARETAYTDELAAQICTRIAEGEGLVKICRDPALPAVSTVYRWIATIPAFKELYELARQDQADTLADEILEIADEAPVLQTTDEDGDVVEKPIQLDSAAIQRQRLRVEARKWVAAKLRPKKYGDRTELVGAGGEPLIPNDPMSRFEAARRIAFILAEAQFLQQNDPNAAPLIEVRQPVRPGDQARLVSVGGMPVEAKWPG